MEDLAEMDPGDGRRNSNEKEMEKNFVSDGDFYSGNTVGSGDGSPGEAYGP